MRFLIKKINLILFNLILGFNAFCQELQPLTYDEVKTAIASYLVDIGFFKGIEEYHADTNTIWLSGFFNEIVDKDSIPDGVYRSSTRATHGIYLFVIVEKDEYKILKIFSREELFQAIAEILDFSMGKGYCKEFVVEYIIKAFRWHLSMQRTRGANCYYFYGKEPTKSNLTYEDLKKRLVAHLTHENFTNAEYPYLFLIDKVDQFNQPVISYALPEENDSGKALSKGYYRFTAADNGEWEKSVQYYLLLGENDYELITLRGRENLNQELFSLINFGIEKKFCFEKVKYVLLDYLEADLILPLESCMNDLKKGMP